MLQEPASAARVVSLNLCADDYLLTLAPEQAAGVTALARDPALSVATAQAARVPAVRADPEAVLALHPDLVLAADYGAQATLAALQRQGVRIERIGLPDSFAAIRAETARIAALLGQPARGAAAVAAMDRELAGVTPRRSTRALLLEPRGWTDGPELAGGRGAARGRVRGRGRRAAMAAGGDRRASARPAGGAAGAGVSVAGDRPAGPSRAARHPPRDNPAGAADLRRSVDGARGGDAGAMTARLAAAVLLLAALSLLVGAAGFGVPEPAILWQLRLPRTVLAALVGGALGLSGAVLQGALRNPLADPGLLGVGGCATLGAVIAFYWGLSAAFAPALPLAGLLGAALGCAVLLGMAGRATSGASLILAGIGLSALAAALLTLALALAPNPFALAELTAWLMGGFSQATLTQVYLAAPPIAVGCVLLLRLGRGLDGLALGEEVAASLGVPAAGTMRRAAAGVALAVGAAASVGGGIGFVGLVVPHLLRPALGERPGGLLLGSMLGGAALLLAGDLLARLLPLLLPLSAEPPLGVLAALLGAPVLVRLARRVAA